MIRAIALDDEPLALQILVHYCAISNDVELVKTFTSISEAKKHISNNKVDLIFLDVNMPEMSGVQFYKSLESPPPVIFTTAYHDYAVDGFDLQAIDYLVKPIAKDRFNRAIEKVHEYYALRSAPINQGHIFIRCDHTDHKVHLSEILYIEALDDYIKIYRKNKPRLVARSSLKNILSQLPESEFIRVHRSYVINTNHVESISLKNVQIEGVSIPVGDTYKQYIHKINL
jgi:DNA-binding LytR/AlgR family response regulator